MDPIRRLSRRLSGIEDMARKANTQPQLADSAIMDGAVESWAAGALRAIMGRQYDGTHTIAVVNGPVPPTPTAPTAIPALEGVKIFWDGLFTDSPVAPMDFARVEVHASTDPDFTAEFAGTLVGTYETPRGGEFFASLVPANYYIKLVCRSQSGGRSTPSASTPVRPEALIEALPPAVTAKPGSSPTLKVIGNSTGMTIQAVGIVDPTTILDYYLDGTLVATTRSTVLNWTTEADGNPMAPGVDYSWTVVAQNQLGAADPSAPVVGRLDPTVDAETVIGWVSAGFVLAGQIQVGTNISIHPETGIVIMLSNGGEIRFPSDGSDANITAKIKAREIEAQNFRLLGQSNRIDGGMDLSNGVAAPTTRPLLSTDWNDPKVSKLWHNSEFQWRGLHSDGAWWVSVEWTWGYAAVWRISKSDPMTREKLFDVPVTGPPEGGVTRLNGDYYVMMANGDKWDILRFNSTGQLISTSRFGSGLRNNPQIGNDGTNILIGYTSNTTTRLYVNIYTAAMVFQKFYVLDASWNANVTGIMATAADFGVTRYVASWPNGIRVFTANNLGSGASQTRLTPNCWLPARTVEGLAWDGSNFWSMGLESTPDTARLWKYSPFTEPTSVSAAFSWFDSDSGGSGQHETEPGRTDSFTVPARGWLKVNTATPADMGNPDDPDSVRHYLNNKRQPDLGAGVTAAVYGAVVDGPAGATSNGFVNVPGTVGELRTGKLLTDGKPAAYIQGSGPGRMGLAYSWDADGNEVGGNDWTVVLSSLTAGATAGWSLANVSQADYKRKLGLWQLRFICTSDGSIDMTGTSDYLNQNIAILPGYARPPRDVNFIGRWGDSPISGNISSTTGNIAITGGVARAYTAASVVLIDAFCII